MGTHKVHPKQTELFTLALSSPTVHGGNWHGLAFLVAGRDTEIWSVISKEYRANNFKLDGVKTGYEVGLAGWAVYPATKKWSFKLDHTVTLVNGKKYVPFLYSISGWWQAPDQLPQNYMFGYDWQLIENPQDYLVRLYLRSSGTSIVLPLE
jgi:hypothetical protein